MPDLDRQIQVKQKDVDMKGITHLGLLAFQRGLGTSPEFWYNQRLKKRREEGQGE